MDFSLENKMCSFCGKPGSAANRLAGGLGAMICFECIAYYHDIVQSPRRVQSMSRPVWEEMSDAELLATLPLILRSAEQNASFAKEWVANLKARKISWAEIGKVLGVTRQAAWDRFAKDSKDSKDSKDVRGKGRTAGGSAGRFTA